MQIKMPRGTKDVLPRDAYKWHFIEKTAREVAEMFSIGEIRFPTFEATELFVRGVGDTTDVVQKEMYTFLDKDERSMTLRPEGTASTVRSFLESGLYGESMPQKLYYIVPCFRYEKPQAGRLREFHQFGIEYFGSASPLADAEVISVAATLFKKLGIDGLELNINSIGCPTCRKEYHAALKEYFKNYESELCDTCRGRLEKNPMRILDCKSEICSKIAEGAPKVIDFLCDDCAKHFEDVKSSLATMGIEYKIDPTIVRGLDYYTRTVFEFISTDIGAQGTVCGGGRYDGLIEELGGKPTPGLGFAVGLERLIMLMESTGREFKKDRGTDIYIATACPEAVGAAQKLAFELRNSGISCETDLMERSLKAQMKQAGKSGASYAAVIGEDELKSGIVKLKDMRGDAETEAKLSADSVAAVIKK